MGALDGRKKKKSLFWVQDIKKNKNIAAVSTFIALIHSWWIKQNLNKSKLQLGEGKGEKSWLHADEKYDQLGCLALPEINLHF